MGTFNDPDPFVSLFKNFEDLDFTVRQKDFNDYKDTCGPCSIWMLKTASCSGWKCHYHYKRSIKLKVTSGNNSLKVCHYYSLIPPLNLCYIDHNCVKKYISILECCTSIWHPLNLERDHRWRRLVDAHRLFSVTSAALDEGLQPEIQWACTTLLLCICEAVYPSKINMKMQVYLL